MAKTAAVSVALCTHNGELFVERQIASILAQDLLPTEIVVSDDASTDRTVEIVRGMTSRAASVGVSLEVVENPVALGVAANFERALLACSGEYIALCDQDDEWRVDRLSAAAAALADNDGLLLLHSDARLVDASSSPLGVTLFEALGITPEEKRAIHEGRAFDALLRRNLVTGATALIRRTLLESSTPFPAVWVHDEWLAVMAAAVGEVDFVDSELIDYRQHGANQIGVTKLTPLGKVRRLFEPRDGRNEYLAARAHVLRERLAALGDVVPSVVLAKAVAKEEHQRARARIPRARLRRIGSVIAEARTGRYALYSRGRLDIARDLLQPAGSVGRADPIRPE